MKVSPSQNILNWYPFKKEQDILEIGESSQELTKLFCEKGNQVTTVEPNQKRTRKRKKEENLEIISTTVDKLKLDKQYDIITLIGVTERTKELIGENLKLVDIIKKLEKYLKPEGKILIAVDNKFGLRFFAGNPENILNKKFESLIGYNNEAEKIETFTKARLERILQEIGYHTSFYYPLPDYRLPNVIFSDRQLPNYTSIDKYCPYYTEKSDILMNEIDVFREILKNDKNMFTFFANSFLVEATKGNCNQEFNYISFNNLRKPKYQLITKIANTYVEKQVISNRSEKHYDKIKNNMKILQENGVELLDYIENGTIKSKYIEQKYLLNNVLTQKLEEGQTEKFEQILNRYIEVISKNSYQEVNYEKTAFGKYKIEVEDKTIIKDLHFLKNGFWDMTFKNCFLVENKFLFFDQEWNEPNLPYEYILYRAILYTISLRRFLEISKLFDKYHLTKYLELFKELDNKLQEKIRDDKMWEFYSQNKKIDIDSTKQEMTNMHIRSKAQQAAMENLQKEKEQIQKEYEAYRTEVEQRITSKIYKKIKKLTGGKHE